MTLSSRGTAFKCHSWNVLNGTTTFMSTEYHLLFLTYTKFISLWGGKRMITTIQCQLGFLCALRLWHLLFPSQLGSWKWSKNLMLQPILQGYTFKTLKPQNCNQYAFWCRPMYELGLWFFFQGYWKRRKKCIANRELNYRRKNNFVAHSFQSLKEMNTSQGH